MPRWTGCGEQAARTTAGAVIVREVMRTAVVTLPPCRTVGDAVRLLVGQGVSSAPVVTDGALVVGMVSEADLLHACLREDPGRADPVDEGPPARSVLEDVLVRDVMTSRVLSLAPTADVWDAARQLLDHGVKAAPVVVSSRLVGLVARSDLLAALGHLPTGALARTGRLVVLGDLRPSSEPPDPARLGDGGGPRAARDARPVEAHSVCRRSGPT